MGEKIILALGAIPNEIKLLIVSMIPIVELRGAIPLGAALLDMEIWETLVLSVIGNLIPVPFLILLTRPLFSWLKKTKVFSGIVAKLESRVEKKADKVMKNAALGLFLFVAIPLPGTGAWTGSMIASLFDMRFKYALPSICIGVVVAGIIMTVASFGLTSLFSFLI
jgi:uncharacterized membrane protein